LTPESPHQSGLFVKQAAQVIVSKRVFRIEPNRFTKPWFSQIQPVLRDGYQTSKCFSFCGWPGDRGGVIQQLQYFFVSSLVKTNLRKKGNQAGILRGCNQLPYNIFSAVVSSLFWINVSIWVTQSSPAKRGERRPNDRNAIEKQKCRMDRLMANSGLLD
jgi:hypothetical protein